MRVLAAVSALSLALLAAPLPARAQRIDGFYGRLEKDLVISMELMGGAIQGPDGPWRPGGDFTLRARFMQMIGLAAGYLRGFGGDRTDALSLAVDFRPAFAARVNYNMQQGPRWLDLMLDSIGVDFGVAWVRPGETWGAGSGAAAVLGTGVELPLHWRDGAEAVMLRLGARWVLSRAWDVQGVGGGGDAMELAAGIVLRTTVRARIYAR